MFSIQSLVKKGLIWSFLDNVLLKGVTFLVTIGLARILSPEDFGIIGVLTIFITLGNALTEGGMGNSIIRDNTADVNDFNSVFLGNLGISFLLYPLLYILAPFISVYFEVEEITSLIRVYGLSFILTAFFNIQLSILTKEMNFKKIALLNLPAVLLGAAIGLVSALMGKGVWSLVYLQLGTLFFKALFYWFSSKWKPSSTFSKSLLKKHFGFGYKLMLSSLLDVCVREVYSVIIGKRFLISTLGFYNQARSVRNYPIQLMGTVISSVTFPLLSKIQEDKVKATLIYTSILRSVFYLIMPIMLVLILLAEPLFRIVLTEKWLPAVPYFEILALAGVLTPIHAINVNVFKVFNRTDIFLKLEVIKVVLVFVAVLIGVFWGIYGLLYGMLASSLLALFVNTYYGQQFVNYTTIDQLKDMFPVVMIGAISFFTSKWFCFSFFEWNDYFIIIMGTVVFITLYIGLSVLQKNKSYLDVLKLSTVILKRNNL